MNDKKKWDKTFEERLDVYYDELKWLYFELYNNDDQALNYFIEMLYSFYKDRSKDLKEMDEAREKQDNSPYDPWDEWEAF